MSGYGTKTVQKEWPYVWKNKDWVDLIWILTALVITLHFIMILAFGGDTITQQLDGRYFSDRFSLLIEFLLATRAWFIVLDIKPKAVTLVVEVVLYILLFWGIDNVSKNITAGLNMSSVYINETKEAINARRPETINSIKPLKAIGNRTFDPNASLFFNPFLFENGGSGNINDSGIKWCKEMAVLGLDVRAAVGCGYILPKQTWCEKHTDITSRRGVITCEQVLKGSSRTGGGDRTFDPNASLFFNPFLFEKGESGDINDEGIKWCKKKALEGMDLRSSVGCGYILPKQEWCEKYTDLNSERGVKVCKQVMGGST